MVWLNAAAVSLSLIAICGILWMLASRGLSHFWPAELQQFHLIKASGATTIVGSLAAEDKVEEHRYLVRQGARDLHAEDFLWLKSSEISAHSAPVDLVTVERLEWGPVFGRLVNVRREGKVIDDQQSPAVVWQAFEHLIEENTLHRRAISAVARQQQGEGDPAELARNRLAVLEQLLQRDTYVLRLADGSEVELPVGRVVRAYQPNRLGVLDKTGVWLGRLWEFLSTAPREANTEGGVFPAIFGTIMMVLVMSVLVTPVGLLAAIYLHEYGGNRLTTRVLRAAINNLAGVPSIVYGIFGLGLFVYGLGGVMDEQLFSDSLPTPTFGTPGLLWASLTLALLTLPVVIVATEEGLARIPRSFREGSYALGATRAETLWRVVLPMASPAIMTGLILAVARAAGEVAPLMLVGVVKLAPALPVDGSFPYLHLDQKFMHLGFHVYDVGFQSANIEAARPLVYATGLLLVVIIVLLNLAAVSLRNRLRERYALYDV